MPPSVREHIERFSPRLLRSLSDAIDHGAVAHGELFASSLCSALPWCTTFDLRESGSVDVRRAGRGDAKIVFRELHTQSADTWHHVETHSNHRRYRNGEATGPMGVVDGADDIVGATLSPAHLTTVLALLTATLQPHLQDGCPCWVIGCASGCSLRTHGQSDTAVKACMDECGAHQPISCGDHPSLRAFV